MIISRLFFLRACLLCFVVSCVAVVNTNPVFAQYVAVEDFHMVTGSDPEPMEEVMPVDYHPVDSLFSMIPTDHAPVWHEMVTNLPRDLGRSAALTFSTSSLPAVACLTAATAILLVADRSLFDASHSLYNRSPFVESASDFFVSLGDGRSQFILAGAFAGYGFVASDNRALRTASQTVESVLATGLVVQVLKHISGRESPESASSHRGKWRVFPNLKEYHKHQGKYYAFPSGHIATAMAAVTVVCENYPEVKWIRPFGYGIVGLIGVGLVNRTFHWYSDLPLGVAIGHMFGMIASHHGASGPSVASEGRSVRFTLGPTLVPQGGGISVAMSF